MNDIAANVKIYDILFSTTLVQDKDLARLIINKLDQCNILDNDELVVLNTYKNLLNDLKDIPSSGTLVSKDANFQDAITIREDSLEDITKLFILRKKKMNLSNVWLNASTELINPGSNFEEIVEKVNKAHIIYSPREIEENKVNTTDIDQVKEKLHEVKEEIKGIKFGISFVDGIYPGVTSGSYNIIAGYTGSMKTTLALNMCYIGLQNGYNTLYISLEVNKEDVLMNLLALHTISTGEPVRRDDLAKMRWKEPDKFDKIVDSFYELPGKIEIYDESDIETYSTSVFDEIIRKTDKMLKDTYNVPLHHIVLDHAQLLKFDKSMKNADPYMIVNSYAAYFRQKAAKENYAVTVVSQTSRQGYEKACRNGGQYQLTSLAEGNELERGATFVLTVFLSDSLKASGQLQIQILKNRYGETMLEPQTTIIKPEYYLVGEGYSNTPQQVTSVFSETDTFVNMFNNDNNQVDIDLNSLLGG